MKAVIITRPGDVDVLELRDVPDPEPARGEVRVRIRATAVNRADLLQRMGVYPAPPDAPRDIPGLEFSGEIDALGEGVTAHAVGDRVFGLAGGGTYAEAIVLPARAVARMPKALDFTQAAAIPEAFLTAYDAMVLQAKLGAGDTLLVSAVGSGVGTAAVQIAAAIGARAYGTARTQNKLDRARSLGMIGGVVPESGRFADLVMKLTGGIDVVLELVGGAYVAEDIACMNQRGRIIVVGLVGGAQSDLNLALLLHKRISILGTVLRARPLEEKILAARTLEEKLVPLFEMKKLAPIIDRILPIDRVREAHQIVTSNETFGKVVLSL